MGISLNNLSILLVSFISFIFVLMEMNKLEELQKPTKSEQKIAHASYATLAAALNRIQAGDTEIELEETNDRITLPYKALKLLGDVLKAMSEGRPISIVPLATEVTTQKAAEILGCSRPHLVKLLEDGKIAFVKVGKHRRIRFEDVMRYKEKMKQEQKQHLIDMMRADEEEGLYGA